MDAKMADEAEEAEVATAGFETSINKNTDAITKYKNKKSDAESSKANAVVQQASMGARKDQYNSDCVNTAESHEDRMAKLRDEQAALKDAKALLRDAEKDVNA